MDQLSQDVQKLERASAQGKLQGRDLEVIRTQVARAEAKIRNATKSSALATSTRRTFAPSEA